MKRILTFLLAGLMAVSLAACGETASPKSSQPSSASSSSQASEPEETSSSEQSQTSSSSGEETPEADGGESSMLVVYFSYAENADLPESVDAFATASIQTWNNTLTGNTGVVANMIAESTGADLFSIRTVEKYPASYDETLDQGQQEQRADARPALTALPENLEDYDVIFLGFPNWWGDMPMALYSFLDQVELSGKTIVPFVTSGGSGFSGTIRTIESLESNATIQEGLALQNSSAAGAQEQISEWLSSLGYAG